MAYPAYDTYNSQVAFPRQYSTYAGDHAYHDPLMAGAYGENYPQPQYPIYTPQRTLSQYASHHYDDLDPYHADAGYATPYAPQGMRQRRYSSMSHRSRPRLDHYARRYGSTIIKFKRKGGFRSGITLGEAMSNVRLSSNDQYSYHDLGVDHRGRMLLKIRWTGYTSMTYEIPVDGYEGRVQLQTVARRIARACVHFLQANMIPISWDRVMLYHLEENSPGVWQPVLSTS
ncbi:unnamed protein product [Somion occarium]|uniref:DUF6741 domain-containing protein n=1 Tax=Somion occarium TaxID=3059160 RepID=A0ABP1D123_9APHY